MSNPFIKRQNGQKYSNCLDDIKIMFLDFWFWNTSSHFQIKCTIVSSVTIFTSTQDLPGPNLELLKQFNQVTMKGNCSKHNSQFNTPISRMTYSELLCPKSRVSLPDSNEVKVLSFKGRKSLPQGSHPWITWGGSPCALPLGRISGSSCLVPPRWLCVTPRLVPWPQWNVPGNEIQTKRFLKPSLFIARTILKWPSFVEVLLLLKLPS